MEGNRLLFECCFHAQNMHVSFWFYREIRLLSLVYLQKIFGINECHTFDMISPSLNKNSFAVDIKNLLKLFHTYRVWILTCMTPRFYSWGQATIQADEFPQQSLPDKLIYNVYSFAINSHFSYRHFFACCRFFFFLHMLNPFSVPYAPTICN